MLFTVRVRFRGLCALAPKRDMSEAYIFLPNESQSKKLKDDPDFVPHHAAVKISGQYLSPGGLGTVNASLLWSLQKKHIKIVPINLAMGFVRVGLDVAGLAGLGTPRQPSLLRPPALDDTGIWWLAPLERACAARQFSAGGGELDPSFLGILEQNSADLLAARFEIKNGKLGVSKFLKKGDDFIVWSFRDFNGVGERGDHRQILGGEILLEDTVDADGLLIEAYDLEDPAQGLERLELYPKPNAEGIQMVELFVMNEEPEQFLPDIPQRDVEVKKPRPQDRLFSSFYRMSKNPPPPDEAPIPVADYILKIRENVALVAPPCSPSRFEPYV